MIDVYSKIERMRIYREMTRRQIMLERGFYIKLSRIIAAIYNEVARAEEEGGRGLEILNSATNKHQSKLIKDFKIQGKRTWITFGGWALESFYNGVGVKSNSLYTKKEVPTTPLEEFYFEMNLWLETEGAANVVGISKTMKKRLAKIIQTGMNNGDSHKEIALQLKRKGKIESINRARRIARTETHTAAVRSVDAGLKSTGVQMEKEWFAAADARTRKAHNDANEERVLQDQYFIETGEDMMLPGYMGGSAWNVVNCRCIVLYFTLKKSLRLIVNHRGRNYVIKKSNKRTNTNETYGRAI